MPRIKKCEGFDKSVASGYRQFLYHATVDRSAVCKTGLKPSCEVGAHGLGQLTGECDPTISFTIDRNIGVEIAKDLRTFINIANGTYTAANITENLDRVDDEGALKTDKAGKVHQKALAEKPSEIFRMAVADPDLFRKIAEQRKRRDPLYKGWTPPSDADGERQWYNFEMLKRGLVEKILREERSLDAIRRKDVKAMPCSWRQDTPTNRKVWCAMITGTRDEQQKALFDMWRDYLELRQLLGGRHNPWFSIALRLSDLKGRKAGDVGLFQVDAFFPTECVWYGQGSSGICLGKDAKWIENDLDVKPGVGMDQSRAEDRNKEVRITRDRFTRLREIPIRSTKKWDY